jgi:hypothetical protein
MNLWRLLPFAVLVFAAACAEDAATDPVCNDDNTIAVGEDEYCIVIEEGFLTSECPAERPNGREFEQFVICSSVEQIPDDAEDAAFSAGFGEPPTQVCEDGETRPADDGCNTCTCVDNAFVCTELTCSELDACLLACGDGCVEPALQVCDVEGESYCSTCVAECYGATLAPNREPCDCPAPSGERVVNTPFTPPPGCEDALAGTQESLVARTREELAAWFTGCVDPEPFLLEEGSELVVRAVFPDHENPTLQAVIFDPATSTVTLSLVAAQYCGGAGPQPTVLYQRVRVVEGADYVVTTCAHTQCTEFFP